MSEGSSSSSGASGNDNRGQRGGNRGGRGGNRGNNNNNQRAAKQTRQNQNRQNSRGTANINLTNAMFTNKPITQRDPNTRNRGSNNSDALNRIEQYTTELEEISTSSKGSEATTESLRANLERVSEIARALSSSYQKVLKDNSTLQDDNSVLKDVVRQYRDLDREYSAERSNLQELRVNQDAVVQGLTKENAKLKEQLAGNNRQ
eukprot:TRINITY_DN339_c0_g1_i1.p1 TRINITY_DN339_c0_g1~~TRINITY_DN339_c0_g1_i1.p1  ORF type:complete len:204 (+),score=68.97 TRINITY_DN339_c0_g1_i1:160-771(+)